MTEREYYLTLDWKFNEIKERFWNKRSVVFHSRDIRKWQKEFVIFIDPLVRQKFFSDINNCVSKSKYSIISSAIRKPDYIKRYGVLNNVYSISLSFIMERTIFFLDRQNDANNLYIIIEKRGKKEDSLLLQYFNRIIDKGTTYVTSKRFKSVVKRFDFVDKKDNLNGLQLSDLIAYPIARKIIDPNRVNPAFDVLESKFYCRQNGNYDGYGLKIFP